jgi:hypothetical protein
MIDSKGVCRIMRETEREQRRLNVSEWENVRFRKEKEREREIIC